MIKITTLNKEVDFIDLISKIKKEIAMLKKHEIHTSGADKANTLQRRNGQSNVRNQLHKGL